MNKPTRFQVSLFVIAVLAMVALAVREWHNYTVGFFLDDGMYVVLADALAQRANYGWYFMPESLQSTHLPFGFPLLLAPLLLILPGQYDFLRVVSLTASVLNLNLIFWGWRRFAPGFSYWWAIVLVALLALSPLTILFSRVVLSEAPFLMWCLLAIFFSERIASKPNRWDAAAFGIASVGLVFTRTIGWFILFALVVYLILKLRATVWRSLAIAAAAFFILSGILVAGTSLQMRDFFPSGYLQILSEGVVIKKTSVNSAGDAAPTQTAGIGSIPSSYLRIVWNGIWVHLDFLDWLPSQIEKDVGTFLEENSLNALRVVPSLLVLALLVYGFIRWYLASGLTAFWLVAPMYLVVILFWAWEGSRFFYPVQPQIVFALLTAGFSILGVVTRAFSNPIVLRTASTVVLLSLIMTVQVLIDLRSGSWFVPRETRGGDVEWISKETPENAVVMTTRPTTYYLYVKRQFVPLPTSRDEEQDLAQRIRQWNVDYVITTDPAHPMYVLKSSTSNSSKQLHARTAELVERGVLVRRYMLKDVDESIFQVDNGQFAQEP